MKATSSTVDAARGGDTAAAAHLADLIGEHEAARVLGMAVGTLRRWRWAGQGPSYVKMHGAVRYSREDLHRFIEESKRRSTSDPGPTPLVDSAEVSR